MPEEMSQAMKKLRPSIDEVLEAARRGIILDWSDNPALYSAPLEMLDPGVAEQPTPRPRKSNKRRKAAS